VRALVTGRIVRGQPLDIHVAWHMPRGGLVKQAWLAGDLCDKTTGAVVHRIHDRVEVAEATHRLQLLLPATMGCDLHTLRLVWVGGLDVALARLRLPLVEAMNG